MIADGLRLGKRLVSPRGACLGVVDGWLTGRPKRATTRSEDGYVDVNFTREGSRRMGLRRDGAEIESFGYSDHARDESGRLFSHRAHFKE
jgi:hypothetical protein